MSTRVAGLSPRPFEPRYEARFSGPGGGGNRTVLHAEGGSGLLPAIRDGRSPSFVAEAGLPLTVTPHADMFPEEAVKVELRPTLPGVTLPSIPLTDGRRDAEGQLVVEPVTFQVPPDAKGILRLRFVCTEADGQQEVVSDPVLDARIIPFEKSTLVFGDDWNVAQEGVIRPGGQLEIAYDVDRLRNVWAVDGGDAGVPLSAVACVSFDGDTPQRLPVTLENASGDIVSDRVLLPAVRVPDRAKSVRIWFEGSAQGRTIHDSDLGKDFRFPLGMPVPEADPEWRRDVNILMQGTGFENLTHEKFVTLGPSDTSYDCYAWSMGIRDRKVEPGKPNGTALLAQLWKRPGEPKWPLERTAQFDLLYGLMGYEPLPTLDLSFDPSVEKVALYGNWVPETKQHYAFHAARQNERGNMESKLGDGPLIEHADPNAVAGKSYGQVFRVYARPRAPQGTPEAQAEK